MYNFSFNEPVHLTKQKKAHFNFLFRYFYLFCYFMVKVLSSFISRSVSRPFLFSTAFIWTHPFMLLCTIHLQALRSEQALERISTILTIIWNLWYKFYFKKSFAFIIPLINKMTNLCWTCTTQKKKSLRKFFDVWYF